AVVLDDPLEDAHDAVVQGWVTPGEEATRLAVSELALDRVPQRRRAALMPVDDRVLVPGGGAIARWVGDGHESVRARGRVALTELEALPHQVGGLVALVDHEEDVDRTQRTDCLHRDLV